MSNSHDILNYTKRSYFFPTRPLMDREYKKFGYKSCEVEKKSKVVNTVFYVRPKDYPSDPKLAVLDKINFFLSLYRAFLLPLLVGFLPVCLVLLLFFQDAKVNLGLFFLRIDLILLILSAPVTIASVFLSNAAEKMIKTGAGEKIDNAMRGKGLSPWSSYKDNDARFNPPGYKKVGRRSSGTRSHVSSAQSSARSRSSIPVHFKEFSANPEKDIITLLREDNEKFDFLEIAGIAYNRNFYAILHPLNMENMDENDALVFKMTKGENGKNNFELILDTAITRAVFTEYNRLLDK